MPKSPPRRDPAEAGQVQHDTNMKKLKIGLLIGLFVYLFICSIPARAGALSLSLDPSIIEIHALPPSNVSSTLSIQNKSDNPVQLQILLRQFKARLENGEPEYLNSQDSFISKNVRIFDGEGVVEDITLPGTVRYLALGPGQQKKLTLNVNIPEDTNVAARPPATSAKQSQTNQAGVAGEAKYQTVPGEVGPARQSNAQALAGGRDYYFSIIFISQNTSSPTSSASLNQLGIASNVLLSVAKEVPNAVLEEFSSGLFYESGPVPFTIRIKNKGNHFIKPKGKILIKNMFGQSIGELDLVAINVLSDSIRAIPNASNLDYVHPKALWKEDFLLGFYTATLNISLSNDDPGFIKSIHFFAFPFQGLIAIVIVLISIIIIVNRVRARMEPHG